METKTYPGLVAAIAILATALGTVLWLSMLIAPWRLASGLVDTRTHLNNAEDALRTGAPLLEARYSTLAAETAARRARDGLRAGGPLFDLTRLLPSVKGLISQADHLVDAAEHSAAAGRGTLDIAQDAIRGPNSIIARPEGKGEAHIRLERLDEITQTLDEIAQQISAAKRALVAVELRRIPRRFRNDVTDGIRRAARTEKVLSDAQAGFAILPRVLGADGRRTYLLMAQNSAELRGTGGAILRFAIMHVVDGHPSLPKTQTVYNVDVGREPISIPLPEDAWYVRDITDAQRFGNANWSPDWPLSARLTVEYAEASRANSPEIDVPNVDGVIVVDPMAMEALLPGISKVTTEGGRPITRANVVEFVLYRAYQQFPNPGKRRALLQQIVESFFDAMFRPDRPAKFLEGMGEALSEKHVQIWLRDPAEQAFIERMNWDGGIEKANNSDYLFVVQQNVGGNKLNYVETQRHEIDVKISGQDALVTTRVRIDNPVHLPQARYWEGDSNAKHRPMINVYVHEDAELRNHDVPDLCPRPEYYERACRLDTPPPAVWFSGPATHTELSKKVWSATLQIPARQSGALSFTYLVPGIVRTEGDRTVYRLLLQHQPKVRPESVVVRLRLPEGVSGIRAKGFKREGATLVWNKRLDRDTTLEVSWRS
jgi:hypothetical protein